MNELQRLVDALSDELGRPVGVDDRRFRALAYSSHRDAVDPVRLASILERAAPREVVDWLDELGVRTADREVRVPANPRFGMAARRCLPLRFGDALLGYLWLIDEPEPLAEAQLDLALCSVPELSAVLYRLRSEKDDRRERLQALAADLLGGEASAASRAAELLLGGGDLAAAPAYAAIALGARHRDGRAVAEAVRVRLSAAATAFGRAVAQRHLLQVDGPERIRLVLAWDGRPDELERLAARLADGAARALAEGDAAGGWTPVVAVGGARPSAADVGASYAEAVLAARLPVAADRGAPVLWDRLGAFRTIALTLGDADPAAAVPAALDRLAAADEDGILVRTLEAYLDHAGDAQAAAGALFVHRSSLYHRLHRIEELAGVDLRSGEDRLELHLGLRLRRLAAAR